MDEVFDWPRPKSATRHRAPSYAELDIDIDDNRLPEINHEFARCHSIKPIYDMYLVTDPALNLSLFAIPCGVVLRHATLGPTMSHR